MSEHNSTALDAPLQESTADRNAGTVPDSLWRRIDEARQAVRAASLSNSPRQSLDLTGHPSNNPPAPGLTTRTYSIDSESVDPLDSNNPAPAFEMPRTQLLRDSSELDAVMLRTAMQQEETRRRLAAEDTIPRRDTISDVSRSGDEYSRVANMARASIPNPESRINWQALRFNHINNQDGDRPRRSITTENNLEFPRRQSEFVERNREVLEMRSSTVNINSTVGSNPSGNTNTTTAADLNSVPSGHYGSSTTGRRDLERALRDYRIARRALRNSIPSEPTSPADQNTPSHQNVLAQLAEQSSNNRNRMRARGMSRNFERADLIADRLALSSLRNEAWQSDDDAQTVVGGSSAVLNELNSAQASRRQSALPEAFVPYLGPNSNARSSVSASGGMRDFYRRIEDRDRTMSRTGSISNRVGTSIANSTTGLAADSAVDLNESLNADRQRRTTQALEEFNDSLAQLQAKTGKSSYNTCKAHAKKVIKYLSELKKLKNNTEKSMALIQEMGIDSSLQLDQDYNLDLPLRIDELPKPQYSSWLEARMTWEGVQKGGISRPETSSRGSAMSGMATGPLFESGTSTENRILHMRAQRHRDRVRSERQQREQIEAARIASSQPQDGSRLSRIMSEGLNHMETLADVERHLTDLLEEEERRLHPDDLDDWRVNGPETQPRAELNPAMLDKEEFGDKWPVKVILHDVDWKQMTVSGTMIASQLPDRARLNQSIPPVPETNATTEKDNHPGAVMETFFDGEIIDFRTHELETVLDKPGYKVGGAIVDLKYWSRLGPFKEVIEKKVRIAGEKKAVDTYEKLGIAGTVEEQKEEYKRTFYKDVVVDPSVLSKEEEGIIMYSTMGELRVNRKWMGKVMGEGGWMFMRWKERQFISPPSSRPSSSSSSTVTSMTDQHRSYNRLRTTVHRPSPTTQAYTTVYADDQHFDRASWGLTIQGFYYVALHRMSGRIEALYYDCGSQPYQELKCWPGNNNGRAQVAWGGKDDGEGSDSEWDMLTDIGIKRDFGVYEFR